MSSKITQNSGKILPVHWCLKICVQASGFCEFFNNNESDWALLGQPN